MKFMHGFVIACSVLTLVGCKNDVQLESEYRDQDYTIDGSHLDWNGKLKYIEDLHLSVGLANDDEFLYVSLVVGSREMQRLIGRNGLILWFDPGGNEVKDLGILYPMGLVRNPELLQEVMEARRAGKTLAPEEMQAHITSMLAEFEVIGAKGHDRRVSGVDPSSIRGIEVRGVQARGVLTIEYKIPLRDLGKSDYAIGADPGAIIGVGLITPEIDIQEMREQMQGRGGGRGGMGGGGRSGGGRSGGRRPGGMQGGEDLPDPIEQWGKLRLAVSPGS